MRIGLIGDSLTQGVLGSAYATRLRRALPDDTLVNLGVGGDTVSSLLRRIRRLPTRDRFDLAFLWVGVNDIVSDDRPLIRITGSLLPQRPASNLDAFRQDYVWALDIVRACAPRVVAVSPLIKGEKVDGELNQRLGPVSDIICKAATDREDVTYLDLRSEILAILARSARPDYMQGKPLRVLWDLLSARSDRTIDRRSRRRGYAYSLDGLHLNSQGADYVAERFLREIARQRKAVPGSEVKNQPE